MKKLRDNGLSITVFALFFIFWMGQLFSGWLDQNHEATLKHHPISTLQQYIGSAHFAEATFENWESEFFQMGAYVVLTAFLFQRGSAESKDPDKSESPKLRDPAPSSVLYKNSLSIAFFLLFLLSFTGHAIGGWREYSTELIEDGHHGVSFGQFLTSSHFWFQSLQNWQSEFLAVGSLVLLTIWLRQDGSPQSKPVNAPNSQTGD